jgi:hypothetical protein
MWAKNDQYCFYSLKKNIVLRPCVENAPVAQLVSSI